MFGSIWLPDSIDRLQWLWLDSSPGVDRGILPYLVKLYTVAANVGVISGQSFAHDL